MKHLQYFQKREPASIAISSDAPGSEEKSLNGNDLKIYKQTLAGTEGSWNSNVAGRISNCCMFILMFVLTSHAVVGKFKNFFEKNGLATKERLTILRVIFLVGRNITSAKQQKIQSAVSAFVNQLSYDKVPERFLTPFKAIAPDLHAQIDTACVTSETVVSALWTYVFSLWLPL
jgi:hypothetical protein